MKPVSIEDVEYIAHRLVTEMMDYGEPMPDFQTRYPGKLEGTLEQPFTYLSGRYVYWTLVHRAAMYFYLIIKNHPFENGNKRMAVAVLFIFLSINKKWITISSQNLYELAKYVAKSLPDQRDEVIARLKTIIKNNLIDL